MSTARLTVAATGQVRDERDDVVAALDHQRVVGRYEVEVDDEVRRDGRRQGDAEAADDRRHDDDHR